MLTTMANKPTISVNEELDVVVYDCGSTATKRLTTREALSFAEELTRRAFRKAMTEEALGVYGRARTRSGRVCG